MSDDEEHDNIAPLNTMAVNKTRYFFIFVSIDDFVIITYCYNNFVWNDVNKSK